ncbi:hypothetical protein GYH30_009681 [Glycine max]|uniref:Uncharacterized protein n=1 Tax=Glycine max TaxID=3847 RepID=K7KJL5_SOYBN|nr:hypothetical protein GYH30_009681 [Glycine max]
MVNHLKVVNDSSELRSTIEHVQELQKFGENVLDATKKFGKLITNKNEIEGLPVIALGLAAHSAVSKGHENATTENGEWIITLDAPSFIVVLQHARNRSLREEIYHIEDLKEFSKIQGALEANDLTHWDITYWCETLYGFVTIVVETVS